MSSLFNSAQKQLPKIVDLFSPPEKDSTLPALAASSSILRSAPNPPSSTLDKISKSTKAIPDTKVTSSSLSDATGKAISVAGIKPEALTNIKSILEQSSSIGVEKVTLPDGTIIQKAKDTQLGEAAQLQSVMTALHGQCEVLHIRDVNSAGALNDSIIDSAMGLGLSGLLDCLAGVADLNFNPNRAIAALGSVIDKGDSSTVKSLGGMVGAGNITAKYPDISKRLLKGYSSPKGLSNNEKVAAAGELISNLNVIDPTWRGTGTQTSLKSYENISPDAKDVLATHPDTALDMQLIDVYRKDNVSNLTSSFYPLSRANA